MRIDLNLNPVVGGKVRVMCKSYRQATKKKAKLERAYPDSCYLIGQDILKAVKPGFSPTIKKSSWSRGRGMPDG